MSSQLIPLGNPCLGALISPQDLSLLQQGWSLIDQKAPEIASWIQKRKGQLEDIQEVAAEAIRVREKLEALSEQIGGATDQVEQSAAAREDAEKREKIEDERFRQARGDLQGRLQIADGRLQDRQRMFSFKNPLYSEWGMAYGPHTLTVAIPVLAYLHWEKLSENCSSLSSQCVGTLSEQSIYLPVGIALLATVLFTRAAREARPLLNNVSQLREQVRKCESSHQTTKEALAQEKDRAKKDHDAGVSALRTAKRDHSELTQKQEDTHQAMDAIRLQVLGSVYKRNVEQLREAFEELDSDPKNEFARKMGIKAMQNVTDIVVTAFSGSSLYAIEGGSSAHLQLTGDED